MEVVDFAREILFGSSLKSKLLDLDKISFEKTAIPDLEFTYPGRDKGIELSEQQMRFPKGHFHIDEKKAQALHSFANHELLAVEMMAAALIIYPHHTDELKRFKLGIFHALQDEQKHFKLYTNRLNEVGYAFGDFPLNDFFWKQMHKLKTPAQFCAVMSLTFEAANLDFAHFYEKVFRELGDNKTANILKVVYEDEISHVQLGARYLDRWKEDKDLWSYYNESLPWPLTPARSKGKLFVEEARRKARLDQEFINKVKGYKDDFRVTHRKDWKE
ncbi:MAG: DUF455 family protein [Bacteriovoracaceae bacterium]|nr:DUF455 family protein [Bacteriovoracaceae bacterium]